MHMYLSRKNMYTPMQSSIDKYNFNAVEFGYN